MKLFNKVNELEQIRKEKAELLELQARAIKASKEAAEIVEEAKFYLEMLGITEKDLERIKTKQRLRIVK